MRRILILDHGQGFGGTVVVAASLMRHLDPTRFIVTLVTAADPEFVLAQVAGAGEVVFLKPRFSYVEASRVRRMILGAQRTMVRRVINRLVFTCCSLLNASYLLRLLLLVRHHRFSLVHCNNFDNVEGMLAAWIFGTPCLMHAHGLVGKGGRVGTWLIVQLDPTVVAISKVVRQSVSSVEILPEWLHVLYNPTERPVGDTDQCFSQRLAFRDAVSLPADAVLFGIVGRVLAWKGQAEFVRACIQAFERVPAMHAIIVGTGGDFDDGYLQEVRKLAEGSPFANRFHFTGFVQDTSSVYAALDVLVHASIEPEPFGLVITEAMAHGVPVIAASTGAPTEFIEDGVTGFLRDPENTNALSECMIELARDAALRGRIGEAGRLYALQAFDAGTYAREFERLYDEAVDKAARVSRASA